MAIAFQDEALSEVAEMFFAEIEPATFRLELLNPGKLNFGLPSLLHVDEYLLAIRNDPGLKEDWNRTVLRCGAYVGEVIRRMCPPGHYHWVDYKAAVTLNPSVSSYGYCTGTVAMLFARPDCLVFPLAKVEKCLEFGAEDNTHFFAQCLVAEAQPSLRR